MNTFEELDVWRHCRKFRNEISLLTKLLPSEEKYRLTDQLLRSSRSVTANIAGGFGRYHYQENIQFCRQARGSLTESLDHLICCFDEKYISELQLKAFRSIYYQCLKLINGYIYYLKNRKRDV